MSSGVSRAAKELIKAEGAGGLFRGLTPTVAREMPGCAIFFAANESVKAWAAKMNGKDPGLAVRAAAGGAAGLAFWTAIFPVGEFLLPFPTSCMLTRRVNFLRRS